MNEQQMIIKMQKEAIVESCLEDEISFCTAACPFRLDVCRFTEKICLGNFDAAFRMYRDATGFPQIAAALCNAPCEHACIRKNTDKAINLRLLEKAGIAFAKNAEPRNYNIPQKKERVAIVGAGISGLACALRLAEKKYEVTIFEKTNKIGGQLWELLPSELFLRDIEVQFMHKTYDIRLNTEVKDVAELNEYHAIYVATGKKTKTLFTNQKGFFIGGSILDVSPVEALAHGLRAANHIESYIKTQNTAYSDELGETKLSKNMLEFAYAEMVIPESGNSFTKDEAVAEASRCVRCKCNACMRSCELMQYYKRMPVKISDDVRATVGADGLRGEIRVATKLIATCSQCGLCMEKCPKEIDFGRFLLQARIAMHKKNSLPWAYHDFFLRDMENANSPAFCAKIVPKNTKVISNIFFPGCQLGASDPDYVLNSYACLLEHIPDVALMTNCCGIPAIWAGNVNLHQNVVAEIKRQWEEWGKPRLIFACPTCKKMFQEYFPGVEAIFLYELFLQLGVTPQRNLNGEAFSVYDPCSSRGEQGLQEAVRAVVAQSGILIPLAYEKDNAHCCGWGGHTLVANPEYTKGITQKQIGLSERTYITYCTNCRDIFASEGKKAMHILDIFFPINDASWQPPTITMRRHNREKLKRMLLEEFQGKKVVCVEKKKAHSNLIINNALREKLSRDLILEDCIAEVVEHCEKGHKLYEPDSGHFFGHLQIGYTTYWVEYEILEAVIRLINAYSHRIKIETGAI